MSQPNWSELRYAKVEIRLLFIVCLFYNTVMLYGYIYVYRCTVL